MAGIFKFAIEILFWGAILFWLFGGDSDKSYNAGEDDGYASGYNETCQTGGTVIAADWDNSDYSRGFRDGYSIGARECLEDTVSARR